jgi:hypothetical protein
MAGRLMTMPVQIEDASLEGEVRDVRDVCEMMCGIAWYANAKPNANDDTSRIFSRIFWA